METLQAIDVVVFLRKIRNSQMKKKMMNEDKWTNDCMKKINGQIYGMKEYITGEMNAITEDNQVIIKSFDEKMKKTKIFSRKIGKAIRKK